MNDEPTTADGPRDRDRAVMVDDGVMARGGMLRRRRRGDAGARSKQNRPSRHSQPRQRYARHDEPSAADVQAGQRVRLSAVP